MWYIRGPMARIGSGPTVALEEVMIRYILMLVLFVTAVAVPSRFAASAPRTATSQDPEVPDSVHEAVEQGRFWRASRILGRHLEGAPDTTAQTILLASKLSAGWGDWPTVTRLLEGRPWLDSIGGGAGWRLLGRSLIELGRHSPGSEALGRYLAMADPGEQDRALVQLRRGLALGEAGQLDSALVAFDRAAELIPWFADWSALLAAEVAAAAGDTAVVRRRLAAAGSELAEGRGWRLRLTAAEEAGDNMAAREAALAAARSAPSASARAAAWSVLGELRLAAGDSARAREAFRSAMSGAPGSVGAVDAARALSSMNPTPDEWRSIGRIYRRHGNAARAADAFQQYLESGAGTAQQRLDVRVDLGEAYFDAGRYGRAESYLLGLAAEDVPASVAARALYVAGRAQYRQGRSQEGQATFARLAERFPGQRSAAEGMFLLADLSHDDQELERARRYYRMTVDAAPDLNDAGLALMRLAGLEFLEGDHAAAAELFEEYLNRHPDGRRSAQATYWAARAYQELGREAEALSLLRELRSRDPLSFYGARAAELLDEPLLDIPMEPAPARDSAADELVQRGLRRVDVLAELDRRDDLVHEVERLRDHVAARDGGEYALAEALTERGYTLTAISMGWDIYRDEGAWNPRLLRVIYPWPFRELIVGEARDQGVNPHLAAGLIRRESAFSPEVSSPAGAIGLMQIMPKTGRSLASEVGIDDFDPELLRQPEVNVHLGVRYLKQMLERFDHQLPVVLSAYNAGPHRARAWLEFPEARDMDLFSERVPYSETRNYIRHVLLHRALYEALYPTLDG